MAPSKLRKAIGAVKDQTSIGLAKVSNSSFISDLDVAIVKATCHDEYPAEEKHIREILSLTCHSRAYIRSCVSTLSCRLGKTGSWAVALKTLILVHRLISEGDPSYQQEFFFSSMRRGGARGVLDMSDFRDTLTGSSDSWDYSSFVRTYARYLDERLEYKMHGKMIRERRRTKSFEEEASSLSSSRSTTTPVRRTPVRNMKTEKIFIRTQRLQQLLDRFLACRPTGVAKTNRLVAIALYPVVKESYQIYSDLQELIGIYVDRFMELEVLDCGRVYEIFCHLSKQFDELDLFYSWCKTAGISRPSEFPKIDRITQQKLDVMDEFIRERPVLLAQSRKTKSLEQLTYEEDDTNTALPPPETETVTVEEEEEEELLLLLEEEESSKEIVPVRVLDEEVDLLNLRDERLTVENHAELFALALFDGTEATTNWKAFDEDEADWETALVESASNLSGKKALFGGGFDMLLLDGMYSQPRPERAVSGSASSVVLPMPVLALPAPESTGSDPFVASLAVLPPAYVQMWDLERKQRLLAEEQAMWGQYARDGVQEQPKYYPVGVGLGSGYVQRY